MVTLESLAPIRIGSTVCLDASILDEARFSVLFEKSPPEVRKRVFAPVVFGKFTAVTVCTGSSSSSRLAGVPCLIGL